jgi:hypothetical protein
LPILRAIRNLIGSSDFLEGIANFRHDSVDKPILPPFLSVAPALNTKIYFAVVNHANRLSGKLIKKISAYARK